MTPPRSGPPRRTPPRTAAGRPSSRRLPAAVYWRRRAVVFGTPLVLIVAIISLFSGGGSKPQQAALTGATTHPAGRHSTPAVLHTSQAANPNAVPSGSCPASSVQVTPSITKGIAGGPISINLALTTTQTACYFDMSGSNVAIKIMSGSTSLWSSQDCSYVVPTGSMTLRNAAPVDVTLSWDGHQSNGSCGATNPWVGPGTYQLLSSVIGSTPTSTSFSLSLPTARTVTKTATPTPTAKPKSKTTRKASSTRSPSASASKTCGDSCP